MELTMEEILAVSAKNGISVRKDSMIINESGLDFRVVFAADEDGQDWVLRFPRREDVIPTAKKEKRILDLVGQEVPFQVPVWEVFTDELIAYRKLQGVPAGTIDAEAKAYIWEIDEKNLPDSFTETLAETLAALHRIDARKAARAGLTAETAEEARQSMKRRMEKAKEIYGVSEALWSRWQNWLADDSLWPAHTGLIHGDLHAGHILIGEEAKVTGLIDWTEAAVADTANDFTGHYRIFGEEALEKLIDAYGRAGGRTWPRMKEHIIELDAAYPVAIAEFALKSGIEEYHEMAREVLGVSKN